MKLVALKHNTITGEYFAPTEEIPAQQFAQEHGMSLYALTVSGDVCLERNPIPECEILGYFATRDYGDSLALTNPEDDEL